MPYSPTGDFYEPDFYEPDFVILQTHSFVYEMSGGFRIRGKAGVATNIEIESPITKRRFTPTSALTGPRNPIFISYKKDKLESRLLQVRGGMVPAITTKELKTQQGQSAVPLITDS